MPTRVLSPPPPSPSAAATPSYNSNCKQAASIGWLSSIAYHLKITELESKKPIPESLEECPKASTPQQPQHPRPAKGSGRRSGSEPAGRPSATAAAAATGRAMRPRPPPGQPVLLSLLLLPPLLLATSLEKGRREVPHRHAEWQQLWYSNFEEFQRLTEPSFDNNTVTNITVQLGGTAFLHCRVRNLGERTISWVRRRDWHILTSGMFTYTNDERFQVLHAEGSDDWTLQIKYVQKRDNGTYECQVSTGTGIMSHFVNLHIVVPEAFILGSGEHHVDVGSGISLVCIIEKSPTPPQYVFWYHNDRMINYDNARGGITVDTEPGPKTQSRLTIRDAHDTDSGNYTCSASNTEPASIFVFVSEGDKMAAILRRKTSSGSGLDVVLWFVLLPLFVLAAR